VSDFARWRSSCGAVLRGEGSYRRRLCDHWDFEVRRAEGSGLWLLFGNSNKSTDNVAEQLRDDLGTGLGSRMSRNRKGGSRKCETQGESSYFVKMHGGNLEMLKALVEMLLKCSGESNKTPNSKVLYTSRRARTSSIHLLALL
jgi:hypothetical protein